MRVEIADSLRRELNKSEKKLLGMFEKQVKKIVADPEVGKPLRYGLRGERSVRVGKFRLVYAVKEDRVVLLRLMHRKEVYRA